MSPLATSIFQSGESLRIADAVRSLLNDERELFDARSLQSPRAMGDAVQGLLSERFAALLGDVCDRYSADFARRAMADLAFTDKEGLYYVVDVKTHRLDTRFNMPNLVSVERLARFYEGDENVFSVLLVAYSVRDGVFQVESVLFVPIEGLSWKCLTIGALGWGQIQIADANRIVLDERHSRRAWMLEFCDAILDFYPREIAKIEDRVKRFEAVRRFWETRTGS